MLTDQRLEKFKSVIANKQFNLTVVLENIHDPHNIGAVLRSCDSVGIHEIFIIAKAVNRPEEDYFTGKASSTGANKWIKHSFYDSPEACIEAVRKNYDKVYTTHLATDSVSLYDLDLTESVALVFGNERDGVSDEMLALSDGNFLIPQCGMVQSLNISVACAVSLYECYRQRNAKGMYNQGFDNNNQQQTALLEEYKHLHRQMVFKKG
jgi:tRNA (guanosine-2'-O-)-methyltransferase